MLNHFHHLIRIIMFPTHTVYQNSITPEALALFNNKDKAGLKAMVLTQAADLQVCDHHDFNNKLGVMLLTAALYDSSIGGKGCMLVCDFINF